MNFNKFILLILLILPPVTKSNTCRDVKDFNFFSQNQVKLISLDQGHIQFFYQYVNGILDSMYYIQGNQKGAAQLEYNPNQNSLSIIWMFDGEIDFHGVLFANAEGIIDSSVTYSGDSRNVTYHTYSPDYKHESTYNDSGIFIGYDSIYYTPEGMYQVELDATDYNPATYQKYCLFETGKCVCYKSDSYLDTTMVTYSSNGYIDSVITDWQYGDKNIYYWEGAIRLKRPVRRQPLFNDFRASFDILGRSLLPGKTAPGTLKQYIKKK